MFIYWNIIKPVNEHRVISTGLGRILVGSVDHHFIVDFFFNSQRANTHNEKTKYKRRFSYSQEDLLTAILEVRSQKRSLNDTARMYKIPKSTLHNKVTEKVPLSRRMGPKPVLLPEEEERLETWILNKAKAGFPMHPDIVKDTVQTILKNSQRENPFIDNRPGRKWLASYLKRRPSIMKQHAETMLKARAHVTEDTFRSWFTELRYFLNEKGVIDVMADSSRIFNADETGVQICPKTGVVLGPKGSKHLYEIASGAEKESITVLCNFSADGRALPPYVVFSYKRVPVHMTNSIPDDFRIGRSNSGWTQSSTYFEYVTKVFHPWLLENDIKFPVILFLDGHKSHLSMELCDFCNEKEIIMYCLPANAPHIMQPCHAIFKPLKDNWRKLSRVQKQSDINITKSNFATIFKQAFDEAAKPETIKDGFKTCGLFPFNENAFDYSKCTSKRYSETSKELDSDVPSRDEYAAAKKVIEHTIGLEATRLFKALNEDNADCDNPLFKIWNLCLKKSNASQGQTSFSENDKLPPCNSGSLESSTHMIDIKDENILLDQEKIAVPLKVEDFFTEDLL